MLLSLRSINLFIIIAVYFYTVECRSKLNVLTLIDNLDNAGNATLDSMYSFSLHNALRMIASLKIDQLENKIVTHICLSPDQRKSNMFEYSYQRLLSKGDVNIIWLPENHYIDYEDKSLLRLICGLELGKVLSLDPSNYESFIAYIDPTFVTASPALFSYIQNPKMRSYEFHCLPSYTIHLPNINDICDYSAYLLKVSMSLYVSNYLKAAQIAGFSVVQSFPNAILKLSPPGKGVRRMEELVVVYSSRFWLKPSAYDKREIALIEFDGAQHKLICHPTTCDAEIYLEWPILNTLPAIEVFYTRIQKDAAQLRRFCDCDELVNVNPPSEQQPRPHHLLPLQSVARQQLDGEIDSRRVSLHDELDDYHLSRLPAPKIFDLIPFFDELSMLLLRLQTLHGVVDKHVIVESRMTFTGKAKPLYFSENMDLFKDYLDNIILVIVEDLPFPTPKKVGEVWANEYFSRNAALRGLRFEPLTSRADSRPSASPSAISVSNDDLIIIADTDEIPDPDALIDLRALIRISNYHYYQYQGALDSELPREEALKNAIRYFDARGFAGHFYKFLPHDYMYSFHCRVDSADNLESRSEYFQGLTRLAAGTWRAINAIAIQKGDTSMDTLISSSRSFHQYSKVLPLELCLVNSSWHLSFFRKIGGIKKKLESYSHQNLAARFSRDVSNLGATWNNNQALTSIEVSEDKISKFLEEGKLINVKSNEKKCRHLDLDNKTTILQQRWNDIFSLLGS